MTKNNSFYTATVTVTDLVNIERVGNRQQDAILPLWIDFNCLMHIVDHFGNEGWFNCDQEIISMCFVFVGKATYNVEEKRRNFLILCFTR